MTEYIVLSLVDAENTEDGAGWRDWREIGRASASNDVAAIKAVVKESGTNPHNTTVAVPVRNWRPRKPEHKVTERTLWK